MTKIGLIALAALSAFGCGAVEIDQADLVPAPDRADEAVAAVAALYGMKRVPTVYWYGGPALDCGDGYAYTDLTGTCVRGDQQPLIRRPGGFVIVAANGLPLSLVHNTSWPVADLPHELAHAASDQRGEGGCADHNCHWFAPGGEGDQATQMLAGMGL